ncbi:hypothetical protein QQS21_007864 [Conoideocrella luteorostrata]|uniref:Uncharacterized protein n=1 Tax=Conoideocrella luteorostrata TaxID=1105319 RepID=A0AAJ0CJW0_9HYPO|nr:hypothetical protein QQS21_007864 [Conoideocrella luteorostrata]
MEITQSCRDPRAVHGLRLLTEMKRTPAGFTDTINSTKWEVNLDRWKSNLQPGTDVVCYLEVFSRTDYWTFNSTYFNVSIPQNTSKAPEPTPSVSSPGAQGTQTNSPDAGTSAQSPQVSERLSTGAVAGIAVGAGIGGLMFLSGLAFFVWKYCRKRQSFNTPNTTPREPMMTGNNEASSWQKNEPGLSELEARQLHELP